MPAEGVTHVAWQVGHLAMAEYRMALDRIRGERTEDAKFISPAFLQLFGKGSVPDCDLNKYPSPDDLLATLDRVHRQMREEVSNLPESEWHQPMVKPHLLVKTKIGGLYWCAQHEMMHAGQIGLLRRLLGQAPLW